MRFLLNLLLLQAAFLPGVLGVASYDEYRDADLAQSGYLYVYLPLDFGTIGYLLAM